MQTETNAAATTELWDKVSAAGGVTVYQKKRPAAAVISVRAEATVAAPAEAVYAVLADSESAHRWVPYCAQRHELAAVSSTERVEYTELHLPWPLTPRYFINAGTVERPGGGVIRLVVRSVDRFDPNWRHAGMVLGKLNYSEFVLCPVGSGQATHVTIELHSDLQGAVPKWLVNVAQRNWPREFFQGLRTELARGEARPVAPGQAQDAASAGVLPKT